jgi:hypothetical protein
VGFSYFVYVLSHFHFPTALISNYKSLITFFVGIVGVLHYGQSLSLPCGILAN